MREQLLRADLWWVVPGKLAGMRKPMVDELEELQNLGIKAIVSLMDDPSNLEAYQQAQIPHLWLPIQGGTAPNWEQVKKLQSFIEAQTGAVAIHCTSGRRRTGTMLAAYLMFSGWTFEQALTAVQVANPEVDLREAQITFLQKLQP